MQQRHAANQVEAQEHGHGEQDVQVGVRLRGRVAEDQAGRPGEDVAAGDGVHGAHHQLQGHEEDPLAGHGDAPVIRPVVHHEELDPERGGARRPTSERLVEHMVHFL